MTSDRITTHWDLCYLDPKHHACAVGLVARLKNRVAELEAERNAVLAEFRRIEWNGYYQCPSCLGFDDDGGHREYCFLAAVLAKATGEEER